MTILTQVGGIIYLLTKPLASKANKNIRNKLVQISTKLAVYFTIYLFACLLIVPLLAKRSGRIPLPLRSSKTFPAQPQTIFTCLMNRHYVRPQLKTAFQKIAQKFHRAYPTISLNYLDANFPFLDGYPLLPHRSHDDGEKLDVGFIYKNQLNKQYQKKTPAFFGYGFCEEPKKKERDQISACLDKGYWQYDLLKYFCFQKEDERFTFDETANKKLLQLIAREKSIRKIFIEPHLKTRLGLSGFQKIRFHGCKAVRHDDHIHFQL
ncbi:MAG: hypothetical protein AAF990_25110 [Bacteroidota bacterium]